MNSAIFTTCSATCIFEEDFKAAIYAYEQVLAQGEDITEGLEVTTLYTIAQLSFVVENYQDALDYMELWISKADNPGPEPEFLWAGLLPDERLSQRVNTNTKWIKSLRKEARK